MTRLLISTGEVSGDLQGGLLVTALRREAERRGMQLEIVALGGERMERAGARLLANTAPMGAIGLWEALPLVWPTLRLQRRVDRWLDEVPPDGVVLIDYMGANINLGLRIKKRFPQVPINYYLAPQEWAFRLGDGGTMRLLGFTDRILAIFPEEARFYGERGADVLWVGHPLLDTLSELPDRDGARQRLGLAEGDAHVIRNAGGRVSDDALRSLVISHKLLGTKEWFVVHHTDCGMEFFTGAQLAALLDTSLATANIVPAPGTPKGVAFVNAGAEGGSAAGHAIDWLHIDDQEASIKADVEKVVSSPLTHA